jgi:hypothetical protein
VLASTAETKKNRAGRFRKAEGPGGWIGWPLS